MSNLDTKPRIKAKPKTQRPKMHKVILINDDFTPREFVVMVLKAVFKMSEAQAYRVMITAHTRVPAWSRSTRRTSQRVKRRKRPT